ncbi:hypothetical protein BKI52_37290 [marine bacterium AO1-C]|nr:hypothetical protein BKI52_37290 [marine bacterium AO1-C]
MLIRSFFNKLIRLVKGNSDDSVVEDYYRKPSKNDIKNCLASWETFKKMCGNSYVYVKKTGSVLDNFYYKTLVIVEKGNVTKGYQTKHMRNYYPAEFEMGLGGREKENDAKVQQIEEIPLSSEEISSLTTLDIVYSFIKKLPKISYRRNYITFITDNRDLVIHAGYSSKSCVDDCFRGYYISSLTPLKAQHERL